jgi:hypothetical protein
MADTPDTVVMMQDVVLAFPSVFEPKINEKGKGTFSASGIFGPAHPVVALLKTAMVQAAKNKWGDKWEIHYSACKASDKLAVHDGAAKAQYAGYAGNLFLNANNPLKPLVIGGAPDGRGPLTAADGKIYPGARVNMKVEIWAQDHPQHGKRINASLMGLQFFKDGERLAGGAVASADDFAAIPQETMEKAEASGNGAADLF